MLHPLDEQAGTACDDGGVLALVEGGHRVVHGLLHGGQILGIHGEDGGVAVGLEHLLHADHGGLLAHQGVAGAGVVLMAGHAGDAVIQHAGDHAAVVVDDLGGAGHAAVEEGGVAHDAEHHLIGDALPLEGLGHAHAGGEAAAHADAHVHAVQRRRKAQRVAADIAGDHIVLVLGQGVEEAAVGAAGTQGGRALGHLHVGDGLIVGLDAQHTLPQKLGVQLVQLAGQLLADAVDAGGLDLVLHEGIQLLNDVQLLHLLGEAADQLHGQGIGQTQLQEGCTLGEHLLGVLVADGRGDDAHLAVAQLHLVQTVLQCAGAAVLRQLHQTLLHDGVVQVGVGGGADVLAGVPGVGGGGVLHTLAELHQTLAVTDAGGGAVQHRGVELLGDLAGQPDEILALLGVAGLHHGDLGGPGIVAVVLLILGGVAGGVVGGDNDIRAVDAHVAGGEQGVGGHVQTHHFHGAEGAGAGYGRAVGHLGGHLLVGRPLAVDVLAVLGQVFQNFRAGRSGVSGTDLDTGFVDAACGGLVTGHQMLHSFFHLSFFSLPDYIAMYF